MDRRQQDRIVFHSKEDGAAGYYLEKVDMLLNNLDLSANMEINDLLELYNVKEYFDNDLYLLRWDEKTKIGYQNTIVLAEKKTKDYLFTLNDGNICPVVESLEFDFRRAFWHLFNYLQIFKRISNQAFSKLLEQGAHQLQYILTHRNTVIHFDKELRDFLVGYEKAAEILLAEFEQRDDFSKVSYIFPKSLSLGDKENIILAYINQPEPNLNYIRLIEHSKDSGELKLSAKTRLKAKKKSEELNNKIFEHGSSILVGVQVTLDEDQEEPAKVSREQHRINYSYSIKFLDERPSDAARFMIFQNLFGFTDHNGLITLYNRQSEMEVLERIMMKSKNEYPKGFRFRQKNQTALLQVVAFQQYLIKKDSSIEELIQSFLQSDLIKNFGLAGLQLKLPSKNLTFLEKIRTLAPELEFLLKQYKLYSTDGKIDPDLIEIDSTPLKFGDVKSLVEKKYAYSAGSEEEILRHHFYSNQSRLHYVKPFNDQYSNFYDLLQNEDVKLDVFANYQQDLIKHLVSENYLIIDSDGYVEMKNDILIYLIGELHRHEAISYWHFPEEVREVLDEMEGNNLIRFESTLLSSPELGYYNYYLNKKGYTNGMNIRNKYLHGSNSSSEKEHENEYFILLMLLILALLKIVDDLTLHKT